MAVVLLVSTLASTMLSSLYLLSSATEKFAARTALAEAPAAEIDLRHRIVPRSNAETTIEGSTEAASELFGTVAFDTNVQIQGFVDAIPYEDDGFALGYFAYFDGIEDEATLAEGAWPEPASFGFTEAAIPSSMADDFGLRVGSTFVMRGFFTGEDDRTVTVSGIFDARFPDSAYWREDRLLGRGHDPTQPIPFSGGNLSTNGYGPLIVTRDVMASFAPDQVTVSHRPDFSQTSLADIESILGRIEGIDLDATSAIAGEARSVTAVTQMDETLGGVLGALAVTRSSVLVTGLLLLVLAVAALGQTARLMAERRHAELMLMQARGAARYQLVWLAVLEAIALAVITTAVGPLLGQRVYLLLASQPAMQRAGMDQDPGIEPYTWAVGGVVGLALIIVLVGPLLRKSATFLEGEQARSRPGKRAAFQRSGLDVALLALAILAYWQLSSYESPVITSGGVARLDPLLAAGPALALLAGALVCVRLIPAASRLLEGIASRGRAAVGPLAAWEVGRRSARAVSAILLLTLALAVGTFSMSFLRTWQTSQEHQAQFLHPADLTVANLGVEAFAERSLVADEGLGAEPGRVYVASGEITSQAIQGTSLFGNGQGIDGRAIQIVGLSDEALGQLDQGRLAEEIGGEIAAALTVGDEGIGERTGIELPGTPAGISFEVDARSAETELTGLTAALRFLIEDGTGVVQAFDAGLFAVDDTVYEDEDDRPIQTGIIEFADAETLPRLTPPLRIVGMQSTWFTLNAGVGPTDLAREDPLQINLGIDNIQALDREPSIPVDGVPAQFSETAVEVPDGISWYGTSSGVTPQSLQPDGDQVHVRMQVRPNTFLFRTVNISQTSSPVVGELPVMISRSLNRQISADVGEQARIEVNGAVVLVRIVGEIPLTPGESPRRESLVVNLEQLQLAIMQVGAPTPQATEWWVSIPVENADRYASALPDGAIVTERAETARLLMEDPLRVGTQAAVWLVTAAAVLLAAVGFAVHAVVTVRAREIEFAQLRAVGLQRGALVRLVSAESFMLSVLGALFGVGVGLALSYLVAPLVSVGTDGRPPVPPVIVDIPWGTVGLLAAEVAAVLLAAVLLISFLLRRINPAQMLRLGD